jgi:RNA polymerase sigma-70 factor (ECF subfamily)
MSRTTGHEFAAFQRRFGDTPWSAVLAAAQADAPASHEAWERLARGYWYPLYAYIRRTGRPPQDAKDLAQAFFLNLMECRKLDGVVPGQRRFRSFLLTCLKNFLADDYRRSQATQRRPEGGFLNWDDAVAERRYQGELVDHATPEFLFEHHWAGAILDQALEELEAHYVARNRHQLFEHLVAHLVSPADAVPHADLAAKLGMAEGSVKNALRHLRRRYQLLCRRLVAVTVPAQEVEAEMSHLRRVLTR